MADADTLIAGLRSDGTSAGSGAFTLDPVKAREKMREFQLGDPHRYVLLLVQALVLRGATRIDVEIDSDDLRMSSDATGFTLDELTELYALLFSDLAPQPGLRELALGLNAAMATDPRWVRIECSGPEGGDGVRLEQRNDVADKVERITGASPGVRIHLRERFRMGLIRRFLGVGADMKEDDLLRRHCRFTGIPITVRGKPVGPASQPDEKAGWHPVMRGERVVGEVGASPLGDKGRLELVRHHVSLTEHTYDDPALAGLHGFVDVSHLRTDASVADVVRDEAYAATIAAVRPAYELSLAGVSRHFRGDKSPEAPLREMLCRCIAAHLASSNPRPNAEPLRDFLAVPLWHTLGDGPRTCAQLLEDAEIRYCSSNTQPIPEQYAGIVYAKGHAEATLRAVFGRRLIDCSTEVARAVLRQANRKAFTERLHALVLPAGQRYEATWHFDTDEVRGIVGWIPNAGPSWMRFIVDNHLLVELPLSPELSTTHVVVSAKFSPTDLFDDVARDEVFATAAHATLVGVAALVREICKTLAPPHPISNLLKDDLSRYLIAVADDSHARNWLSSLGMTAAAITALCDRLGRPWRQALPLEETGELSHPIAALPLFEDAARQPVDLRRVALALRDHGVIRVIALKRPPLAHPPAFVVRVGDLRCKLIEALFGAKKIRRVGHDYEKWIARETFATGTSAQPLALDGVCVMGPLEFVGTGESGTQGLVGLTADIEVAGHTPTRVFVDGRPICTLRLGATLCGLIASLEVPASYVNDHFTGIEPAGTIVAEALLAVGVGAVLDRLIELEAALTPRLQLAALDAVGLACPAPEYMHAWMMLDRAADSSATSHPYLQILALGDHCDAKALSEALRQHLTRRTAPDPESIRTAVEVMDHRPPRARPSVSGWSAARTVAARQLHKLVDLPLVPTEQGPPLALRSIIDAIRARERFDYLPPSADVPTELAEIPRLDATTVARLVAQFGANRLHDRSPELGVVRQRLAFEERPPLAELTLDAAVVLTSIVVEIDGIRGTIGVPRSPPMGAPGQVTITRLRRPIVTLDPMPGTPWLGVLDGDGFGEESQFADVTTRELERIVEIIELHRPMIISALCDAGFSDDNGPLRRCWVQHLLRQVLPLAGYTQASLEHASVPEVQHAPLFIDAEGGARTLGELSELYRSHESLAVVRRQGLRTDRLLVVLRDQTEEALLAHLFGPLEDAEPLAEKRAEFAATLAAAAPLATPPSDAYAVQTVDSRGLVGALWLSAEVDDSTTISLGIDGRAVWQWRGSRMFPCGGSVSGPGIAIASDQTGCSISRSREDHLKSQAAQLYVRLVASLRDGFGPVDDPRTRLLAALVLRLHEIRAAGRRWPTHEMRRLYRDLRDAPLLPVASARAISLRVALEARPHELAGPPIAGPSTDLESDDHATRSPEPIEPSAPVDRERVDAATPAIPEPPSEPTTVVPIPPTPSEILRARIVAELRLLHRRETAVLSAFYLDQVRVADADGKQIVSVARGCVVVDTAHPVVRRALDPQVDPLLLSVIASAALTALNLVNEALTDGDEARLLRLHAEHLLTARGASQTQASAAEA